MKALFYLNVRLFKNTVVKTLKNPRQVIPALFIGFLFGFPMVTMYTLGIRGGVLTYGIDSPFTTETVKPIIFSFFTFITLMTVLHSTTKNTLVFSLPEIDFLFPSPLKRKTILLNRMLINYTKLAAQYLGIGCYILFIFSFLYGFSFFPRILFFWLATFLAMVFASNLGGFVSLLSSHLSEMKRSRNRRILIGVFVIFLGTLLGLAGWHALQGTSFVDALVKALNSSVVRVLMFPMAAASDVAVAWKLTADVGAKIAFLAVLCIATTGGILSVETHFYEASEVISRELWESLHKVRRQEVVVSESFVKRMFKIQPFGKGSTALAWKNLVGMLRDVRSLLPTVFMAIFLFSMMFIRGGEFFNTLFFLFFLVFIVSGYVRWDFREDLRRIEIIKLIPDSNFRIVLSEIAVPVLFSIVVSYIFLGITFLFFPDAESKMLLTAFCLGALPLFSIIMVVVANLSALYYPPQTNSQVVPGMLSMVFMVVILMPSFLLMIFFLVLEKLHIGLLLVLLLNAVVAGVLLKFLTRKYRSFDLTSS